LIPSPFSRGEQNSKRFVGLASGTLAVGCERSRGVDPELSEHSGDVRGWGGHSDRSRTKDRSGGAERLQSGEVDDGDGDRNRGVNGVCLGKWDRGVSNGSGRVFEVIVAIRRHILGCVLVKELRTSRSWGVRRLSGEGAPYMYFSFGIWTFELPNFVFREYVILIDPHVVRVRVSFPFDQILKSPSSAKPPRV
jgi:hypothetical protein